MALLGNPRPLPGVHHLPVDERADEGDGEQEDDRRGRRTVEPEAGVDAGNHRGHGDEHRGDHHVAELPGHEKRDSPRRDQQADGGWVIRTYVKPLANWIWAGCILMSLGGTLSLTDRRFRVAAGARRRRTPGGVPAE